MEDGTLLCLLEREKLVAQNVPDVGIQLCALLDMAMRVHTAIEVGSLFRLA